MREQWQVVGGRARHSRDPRGVVLVITMLLVGLFLVMAMTMINLAASDYQVARNESRSIQALYNADAGGEEAKMRLSPNAPTGMGIAIGTAADWRAYILSGRTQAEIQGGLDPTYGKAAPDYTSTEGTSHYAFFNTVQTGTNAIQWGWARIQHKVSGASMVYQDAITGAETTNASQVDGSGKTIYNPPILMVTAEGIQGSVRRMIQLEYQPIVSTTTTTDRVVTDPFGNAIHSNSTVTMIGNASTDSYNSIAGPYNVNGNKHSKGDVGTDAVSSGAVSVSSNSTIDGSVAVGPGGDPSTVINNQGTITGTTSTEATAWNLPLSSIPAGVSNQGSLSISGNRTVTLNEGTYWYSSLSITGNGQLRTNGAVKIYVTGNIDIGGNGVATAANKPPNLLIYGTVDPNNAANQCTSVSIHGNGDFYGAVYAPAASIQVSGNGSVYGSLTGNTVQINGSSGATFHYDEALSNLGETVTTSSSTTYATTGYSRYSWREIAF